MNTLAPFVWIVIVSWVGIAQGTMWFANIAIQGAVSAPIFEMDGVTRAAANSLFVQLHAAPDLGSLSPVGTPVLIGPDPGYFVGGTVVIPNVPPGQQGWFQVFAWDWRASAFNDAQNRGLRWGVSNEFSEKTALLMGNSLIGLQSMILQVPEPPGLALVPIAAVLLARRCFARRAKHKVPGVQRVSVGGPKGAAAERAVVSGRQWRGAVSLLPQERMTDRQIVADGRWQPSAADGAVKRAVRDRA